MLLILTRNSETHCRYASNDIHGCGQLFYFIGIPIKITCEFSIACSDTLASSCQLAYGHFVSLTDGRHFVCHNVLWDCFRMERGRLLVISTTALLSLLRVAGEGKSYSSPVSIRLYAMAFPWKIRELISMTATQLFLYAGTLLYSTLYVVDGVDIKFPLTRQTQFPSFFIFKPSCTAMHPYNRDGRCFTSANIFPSYKAVQFLQNPFVLIL